MMMKLKAALQGDKIHTTKFDKIGSAFPTRGENAEAVRRNFDYLHAEFNRWWNSVAFVMNGAPLILLQDYTKSLWQHGPQVVTEENAATIQAALVRCANRIAPSACSIVRSSKTGANVEGPCAIAFIQLYEVLRPFMRPGRDEIMMLDLAYLKGGIFNRKTFMADTSEITWTPEEATKEMKAISATMAAMAEAESAKNTA